jgi:hypothetical protein
LNLEHNKKSLLRLILYIFQDLQFITQSILLSTKINLLSSIKSLAYAVGYIVTTFILLNVSLLFLLIALAYGFIQIGLAGWISFLLVAAIMIALAVIFIVLAIRSFSKVRGIGDASRIGSETKRYLSENFVKPEKPSGWNSL